MWLILGWFGFVYWWTKDYDFTSNEVYIALAASITGPIAWILGFPYVHNI